MVRALQCAVWNFSFKVSGLSLRVKAIVCYRGYYGDLHGSATSFPGVHAGTQRGSQGSIQPLLETLSGIHSTSSRLANTPHKVARQNDFQHVRITLLKSLLVPVALLVSRMLQ